MFTSGLLKIAAASALLVASSMASSASVGASTSPSSRVGAEVSAAAQLNGRGSTERILAFLVLLLILGVALGQDRDGPQNPVSP